MRWRKILTLVVAVALISVAGCKTAPKTAAPPTHFYFVQITDTHFGDGSHNQRTERLVNLTNMSIRMGSWGT